MKRKSRKAVRDCKRFKSLSPDTTPIQFPCVACKNEVVTDAIQSAICNNWTHAVCLHTNVRQWEDDWTTFLCYNCVSDKIEYDFSAALSR